MGEISLHWMVIGYISPGARAAIEECGGKVEMLEHNPPFIAVAIAYNPAGATVWNSGNKRFEHKTDLEFWNSGEIQEPSTGINLQWGPRNAECYSVEETYLILPDEEYDPPAKQVKELEPIQTGPVLASNGNQGDDFDPFLDSDEGLP